MQHVAKVIEALNRTGARSAAKFISPDLVVRATRPMNKRTMDNKRSRAEHFIVTIGKPNHRERLFIKDCKQAREPFPIKNIRIKGFPAKG